MAKGAARQAGQSIAGKVEAGEAAQLAERVGLKAGRRRVRLPQDSEPLKAAQAGKGAGRDDLHGAVLQGQLSIYAAKQVTF